MAAADGDGSPPQELRLAWECERWHCLPDTGAYLDQDYKLLTRMTICANVYSAVSHLRNAQGIQIHKLSESDRHILGYLVRIGLLFNGNS